MDTMDVCNPAVLCLSAVGAELSRDKDADIIGLFLKHAPDANVRIAALRKLIAAVDTIEGRLPVCAFPGAAVREWYAKHPTPEVLWSVMRVAINA